MKRKQAGEG